MPPHNTPPPVHVTYRDRRVAQPGLEEPRRVAAALQARRDEDDAGRAALAPARVLERREEERGEEPRPQVVDQHRALHWPPHHRLLVIPRLAVRRPRVHHLALGEHNGRVVHLIDWCKWA